MKPLRCYVAGPMTGLPEFNFPAFHAAADRLRAAGIVALNPADHGVIDGATWADYMRLDIAQLVTCDAIVLLPGWEQSKGATLEHHIATTLGLQVFQTVEGVIAFAANETDGQQHPTPTVPAAVVSVCAATHEGAGA